MTCLIYFVQIINSWFPRFYLILIKTDKFWKDKFVLYIACYILRELYAKELKREFHWRKSIDRPHASGKFFYFGLSGFVSWIYRAVVSAGQGRAFDNFLIHVAASPPRGMRLCMHAVKTYIQLVHIDLIRSRARSKGIGYLALPLLSTSRVALYVRTFAISFQPISRSFSLVVYYFVDRPLRASSTVRTFASPRN